MHVGAFNLLLKYRFYSKTRCSFVCKFKFAIFLYKVGVLIGSLLGATWKFKYYYKLYQ